MTLQQDARLQLQREALQQRQAELRSVDQRIFELQTRLQRKKAANIQVMPPHGQQQHPATQQQQQQQQHLLMPPQQQQQQQQQVQQLTQTTYVPEAVTSYQTQQPASNHQNALATKQGVAALKQQLLAKQAAVVAAAAAHHAAQQQQQQQQSSVPASKFAHRVNENRSIPRGNVAAVEPYIHTPQKSSITPTANFLNAANNQHLLKHAATANTNQQNQLIQDMTHVKLNLSHSVGSSSSSASTPNSLLGANHGSNAGMFASESDESKLAKKMLTASISAAKAAAAESAKSLQKENESTAHHIYAEVGPKKRDLLKNQQIAAEQADGNNTQAPQTQHQTAQQQISKIPKSILSSSSSSGSSATALISKLNNAAAAEAEKAQQNKKSAEVLVTTESLTEKKAQLTVQSLASSNNKSMASNIPEAAASMLMKPKPLQAFGSNNNNNLAVPPRKPISSVAPTSVTSSIPKMINYSPKVNRVAPNIVASSSSSSSNAITTTTTTSTLSTNSLQCNVDRPALPPKPSKMSPTETNTDNSNANKSNNNNSNSSSSNSIQPSNINDNLPIKAKPLTIRKQPMCEQPRLKSASSSSTVSKLSAQLNKKFENQTSTANNHYLYSQQQQNKNAIEENVDGPSSPHASPNSNSSQSTNSSLDEPDRSETHLNHNISASSGEIITNEGALKRRTNSNPNTSKPKLTRRVSFDPLALLLDASLEGELELVKKTAQQVANPSAANDEGITALHNAICAGHFDIVK